MSTKPLPLIQVRGDHREVGRQIGEELCPLIQRYAAALPDNLPPGVTWEELLGQSQLYPASICKHGLDSVTVFSQIINLNERQAWIGRGRPCQTSYLECKLAPNYRGSTGYGRDWQFASRFDFGGCDTEDVVAGADYLAGEGLANPARIAVTGRSWGGHLTMTALTGYPDRWAGGSAVVPFLNWFTAHANSREDLQHWDKENFGHPEWDRELYYERSPFFFLERIEAPVQMICGAHDIRCPASESIQTRDRLEALGKTGELALYDDEGHSFLKIENVIDARRRQVTFLARILGNVA